MTEKIDLLTLNEAIRKHPAMYIGSTSIRGFVYLLRNIISNIFEETNAGYFSFEFLGGLQAKIVVKNIEKPIFDNAVTNPTWDKEKYEFGPYELPALNALSKEFNFEVYDKDGNLLVSQIYEKGELKEGEIKNLEYSAEKIELHYELDTSILEISEPLNPNFFIDEIKNLAFLYKEKIFEVKYQTKGEDCRVIFKFDNGLKDKIEIEKLKGLGDTIFNTYFEKQFDDFFIEAAFGFRAYGVDESFIISYVNDHHTHENGTHVSGLLKGLTYGVMKYFQKHELTQKYKISEKGMKENLVAAIHVKMKKPQFSGCVRNKLASPEIIEPMTDFISELLFQKIENDAEATELLIRKFKIFD